MLLRAGALRVGSLGVLIAGPPESGKTTLVALLSQGGSEYLTDGLAFVPNGGRRVWGLDRPLGVQRAAMPVLDAWTALDVDSDGVIHTRARHLVPPSVLGDRAVESSADLGLILFPARRPGRRAELRRLPVENLKEELWRVTRELGLDWDGWLPHANQGIQPRCRHYSEAYTPELVEIVADKCGREIAPHGYRFEGRPRDSTTAIEARRWPPRLT